MGRRSAIAFFPAVSLLIACSSSGGGPSSRSEARSEALDATSDSEGAIAADIDAGAASDQDSTLAASADDAGFIDGGVGVGPSDVMAASDERVPEAAAPSDARTDMAANDDAAPNEAGANEASTDGTATSENGDTAASNADAGDAEAGDAETADGGAGDATGNGADGSPIVAVLENGNYVFVSGNLSFAVDPRAGGRVVSFSLAGQNVLSETDANVTNYGSTFWTSPQSDWNWPPPREIDNQPYAAFVDGGALILQGAESPALGVKVTKVFSLDGVSSTVTITYTIENVGASPRSFSPWEVTRVRPGGTTFFPTGAGAHSSDGGPPLPTQQAAGATWFDYAAATITASIKYFADGSRGWLAQENGGVLFVKKFIDVPFDAQAPGEAEIEVYVSGDRAYVEIENQGAYAPIAAGMSQRWTVRWYLVKSPAGVDASVGSASLISFVDSLK